MGGIRVRVAQSCLIRANEPEDVDTVLPLPEAAGFADRPHRMEARPGVETPRSSDFRVGVLTLPAPQSVQRLPPYLHQS